MPRKQMDEMDESYDVSEAASLAKTLGAAVEIPPPPLQNQQRQTVPADQEEIGAIDGMAPVPVEIPLADRAAPPAKRVADAFKNLIPHTDRLAVYKISSKGHKGIVGDYSAGDLDRAQSIEMFIKEYISPTYGAGDYVVEVRSQDGKVKKAGLVNIPNPVSSRDNSPSLSELLHAQQVMQKEAEQKSGNQMQNMMQMLALFKEFSPKGAASSADNSMMPMMMMMMMQNQQKPAQDPMVGILLSKIDQMERDKREHFMPPPAFLPPLPPPPPEYGSGNSLTETIKVVGEIMKASMPQQQQQNTVTELLPHIMALASKHDSNSLSLKDIMNLLPAIKDMVGGSKEGVSSFNDYLEGLLKLDEIRGTQRGEDHSVWAGLAETVAGVMRDIKMQQMKLEMVEKVNAAPQRNALARQRTATQRSPQPKPVELQDAESKPKPQIPTIPVTFRKYTTRMKEAYEQNEEQSLVAAFMEGLLHLRERSKDWTKYIDEAMTAAASGNKERAMKFIQVFLMTFEKQKLISKELAGAIHNVIDLNWDAIMEQTGLSKAIPKEDDAAPESQESAKDDSGDNDDDSNESVDDDDNDEVDPSTLEPDEQKKLQNDKPAEPKPVEPAQPEKK